ncbi:MAG TPA: hypothetical protein VL356_09210 [Acidocella sp.]|jgi:hypothetical protein|nr:hypothetical protein [Acidocella sp.]
MIRLFADLCPAPLLAVIPLAACAAAPPYAPTVLAWPHAGESVTQFQADDLACRNRLQTLTTPPGSVGAGAQSPYDAVYAQCMTSKSYVVEHTNLLTAVTAPPRYGYAYPGDYPSAGDDTSNSHVHPGGYPYYVTYPHFIGTLPFFFFVDRVHHHHR